MLSIYIVPEFVTTADGFAAELRQYVKFFRSARPAEAGGEVLCPGDAETRNRAQRRADGVPLPGSTWQSLLDAAEEVGMQAAEIAAARAAALES